MIDKFISCMKEQGWTVERNEKQRFCLPEPMKSRYTGYPESWVKFVSIVKGMIRGDERAWFLCSEDDSFENFMEKIISEEIRL